jgi:uncharacterized protein YoxC
MVRQLKPQRTTPPTQNDLRQALASVDSLIVNVEGLQEWRKEVNNKLKNQDSEIIAAFEKQLESLFARLNRYEAKLKELDKAVNGKKATASPLKVAAKSASVANTANTESDTPTISAPITSGDNDVE